MDIDIAQGVVWFISFLFSTTVHEAMHAFAAWKLGDPTAYHGGQVSLSPVPHVRREPIGMLVLPLLTAFTNGWAIGWASVPYDPRWAERYPHRAALMAAAGPAGNFLIAATAFLIIRTGLAAGMFVAPDHVNFSSLLEMTGGATFVTSLLSVLLVQNVFLGIFNLLPLPPLDGAAVFGIFLPERAATVVKEAGSNPMMSMIGLVVAWQIFPVFTSPLFGLLLRLPLFGLLLRLVHPGESYS
jgi:Zn-dependent protease